MRAAAGLLAVLLAGPLGCELVTDLDAHHYSLEQSGAACPSIGSSTGQLTTGDPSCDTCLATQCCGATTSCFGGGSGDGGGDGGGSECAQLELCTLACPSEDAGSCRSACIGNYLGGLAGAASLSTCVSTSCSTSCPTL